MRFSVKQITLVSAVAVLFLAPSVSNSLPLDEDETVYIAYETCGKRVEQTYPSKKEAEDEWKALTDATEQRPKPEELQGWCKDLVKRVELARVLGKPIRVVHCGWGLDCSRKCCIKLRGEARSECLDRVIDLAVECRNWVAAP
jgi:hypothetical protein